MYFASSKNRGFGPRNLARVGGYVVSCVRIYSRAELLLCRRPTTFVRFSQIVFLRLNCTDAELAFFRSELEVHH
jgi:hypothetical protein